jgi:hypothetical protein
MNDEATVVFQREPLTNVLFNRMAERRLTARPCGHGNYLPALDAAEQLLAEDRKNNECALLLIFLSDGRPSDQGLDTPQRICDRMQALAQRFGQQLVVATIGFAGDGADFSLLRSMAFHATSGGAKGLFNLASSTNLLSSTITTLVTALSATETQITTGGRAHRTRRAVLKENALQTLDTRNDEKEKALEIFDAKGWAVYGEAAGVKRWVLKEGKWVETALRSPKACGVIVREKCFAEGAERIVYELREVQQATKGAQVKSIPPRLVAKEHRHTEDENLKINFHKVFCETQQKSQDLAKKFNTSVMRALVRHGASKVQIARIEFLECSVYTMEYTNGLECGYLVEKRLEFERSGGACFSSLFAITALL